MPASDNVRSDLRAATAPCHTRVDAIFSRIDLGHRDGYGRFLRAQAAAHLPVEEALDRAGAAMLLADWPERQRAAALRDDLAALGLDCPVLADPPVFAGDAAMLGAIYVLEGSRLGGRVLRRTVPAELPATFLGAGDPAAWRRLLAILDTRLADEPARTAAIDAAITVFAIFEESGRRHLDVAAAAPA